MKWWARISEASNERLINFKDREVEVPICRVGDLVDFAVPYYLMRFCMLAGTGYVLGTGKQVNAAGVGANLQMPGKQWFIDNWVVVGAGILGLYYMYSSFTN